VKVDGGHRALLTSAEVSDDELLALPSPTTQRACSAESPHVEPVVFLSSLRSAACPVSCEDAGAERRASYETKLE
jgi:hypothetical protein